jgi:uncharacterized protein
MVSKMFKKLVITFCLVTITSLSNPWGKDADIVENKVNITQSKKPSLLATTMKQLIRFHQAVISPADGPRSHFRPSSSQYMFDAVQKYGFLKGYILGCDRLLRENNDPWYYPMIPVDNDTFVKSDPVR